MAVACDNKGSSVATVNAVLRVALGLTCPPIASSGAPFLLLLKVSRTTPGLVHPTRSVPSGLALGVHPNPLNATKAPGGFVAALSFTGSASSALAFATIGGTTSEQSI